MPRRGVMMSIHMHVQGRVPTLSLRQLPLASPTLRPCAHHGDLPRSSLRLAFGTSS